MGNMRRVHRRVTRWVAHCRVGNLVVSGSVLDISAHGAFFAPEGNPPELAEDSITVGQRVAIAFDSEPNLVGLDLPCRVRWIGYSSAHRRRGVGLEFTSGPISST
jgi:hypothetical protein